MEPMYSYEYKGALLRDSADFQSGSPVAIREPIAVEFIGGYLKAKGMSVDVIQQTVSRDEEILSQIEKMHPKILGVSIHSTHIIERVLDFLRKCRERFPDMVIVCGGNHPSCVPEIVAEECIDFVVRGEGEETFYELTKRILENDARYCEIEGLSFKKNGQIIHNLPRGLVDFSRSPWPLRKKEILGDMKSYPLAYPSPPNQKCAAQISYSRGCPYTCEFCVSPIIFPGRIIYRNPVDVVDEIKYLQKTFGTNFLFFTDLTFNSNPLKVSELCDRIKLENVSINWFAYASVHATENVVSNMASAGCSRIGVGVESVIDKIIKIYKSQQNLDSIKTGLGTIDKYGILSRVYVMLGYPEETRDMLEQTCKLVKTLPIDQMRLAFVTPFPGTPFYNKLEEKLITKKPYVFTGDYPVLKNENVSPEEYTQIRGRIMENFYNSDEYFAHVNGKVKSFPHLTESFRYFVDYLYDQKLLKHERLLEFVQMLRPSK
jgi:anaerobic magnesium-protoporphyrin IX monomethyl ester cyclase